MISNFENVEGKFKELPIDVFWHILKFSSVLDIFQNICVAERRIWIFTQQPAFFQMLEKNHIKPKLDELSISKFYKIYNNPKDRFRDLWELSLFDFKKVEISLMSEVKRVYYWFRKISPLLVKEEISSVSNINISIKKDKVRIYYDDEKSVFFECCQIGNVVRFHIYYPPSKRIMYSQYGYWDNSWYKFTFSKMNPDREIIESFHPNGCPRSRYEIKNKVMSYFQEYGRKEKNGRCNDFGKLHGQARIICTYEKYSCNYKNGLRAGIMEYMNRVGGKYQFDYCYGRLKEVSVLKFIGRSKKSKKREKVVFNVLLDGESLDYKTSKIFEKNDLLFRQLENAVSCWGDNLIENSLVKL